MQLPNMRGVTGIIHLKIEHLTLKIGYCFRVDQNNSQFSTLNVQCRISSPKKIPACRIDQAGLPCHLSVDQSGRRTSQTLLIPRYNLVTPRRGILRRKVSHQARIVPVVLVESVIHKPTAQCCHSITLILLDSPPQVDLSTDRKRAAIL